MENFNINDLITQLQEEEGIENLSAEERANKIAEIENTIKSISKLLHKLFEKKEELEAEEEKYQREQEMLNQRYMDLNDIFGSKK